ncbi:MAG: hypothetical protein A3F67_08975 [Verrucomicrobia bacterium RIFCSPHIGHO2_12_FULL_41_10]|nr:MAG: hypothetical protein A3F67_08975 [Verrucomicrobia bacterium RIFCSPHIGHO2_12_FULL_41_10]HLB33082.1 inositol phosphate phosphatase SopB [Chthoniobacterales bacterium]
MNDFSTYQKIAKNYDLSWSSSLGLSGQSKQLQDNQITTAPQKTLFGNFLIKCLPRTKNSPSSTKNIIAPTSTQSSTASSTPDSIGSHFRKAIVAAYGESVAATVDKQYSLSGRTQLSDKQISRMIKTVSSPILPARLNQNNWTTIDKTISTEQSGLQSNYHSTMVPTAQILQASYQADGIKGVCSRDYKNSNHSINAWSDQLESADGRRLFSCVRSGVVAVLDPKKQEETFNNRLNENILTALYARGELPTSSNQADHPIELSLVDIGLVSNYTTGINESAVQTAQFNLLSAANGKTREISYTPPNSSEPIKIYITPKIRALNIGTNFGDSLNPPNADQTDATIRSVLEETAAFLEDSSKSISPTDRRVVQELYNQCKEMHDQKIYLTENNGDYCAFHARFGLLCYKIGITPMIHCKSGTNRTSRAIEETKFLAAEIDDNIAKDFNLETKIETGDLSQYTLSPNVFSEPSRTVKVCHGSAKTILEQNPYEISSSSIPVSRFKGSLLKKELVPASGKLNPGRQKRAASFFLGVGTQEMQKLNCGDIGSLQYYFITKRIPNEQEAIKKYQGVYGDTLKSLKKIYNIFIPS